MPFSSEIGPELAREILPELGASDTQKFVLHKLLPLLRERMSEGLVGDIRTARVGRSGVIVRNLDTGQEVLKPDVTVLPDVQSFLTEISTLARGEQQSFAQPRRQGLRESFSRPPAVDADPEPRGHAAAREPGHG